jgi:hypothetical protein
VISNTDVIDELMRLNTITKRKLSLARRRVKLIRLNSGNIRREKQRDTERARE